MWGTLQPDVLARLPHYSMNGKVHNQACGDQDRVSEAERWKKCIDSLLRIRLLEND
jgi:hypothetical protein